MSSFLKVVIYLSVVPLLVIGYVVGFVYSALECGFWHGKQHLENNAMETK